MSDDEVDERLDALRQESIYLWDHHLKGKEYQDVAYMMTKIMIQFCVQLPKKVRHRTIVEILRHVDCMTKNIKD